MKHKISILSVLIVSIAACLSLLACGDKPNTPSDSTHTHSYGAWQYDEISHWKECSCGDTDSYGAHSFDVNNKCTQCGYQKGDEPIAEHKHAFSKDWASDETYHWHAAICEKGSK